ncbi:MAG: glutamate--tRNA ligase family protein, partial [Dehalococcoidia bacterium]|nr:glutamate--tRNA ligase family protein [Dehalococcoidia bacterium]
MTVRVRYAPSPTGEPHVGNIRTALFNWLFARHEGGAFIVRFEDTDRARYVEGAEQAILESLAWLGLDYDEGPDPADTSRDIGGYGPYVQSRRVETYRGYAGQLIEGGHAYRCYCTPERLGEVRKDLQSRKLPPKYDRHCRDLPEPERERLASQGLPGVVRFKTPLAGQTAFHDLVRGDIVFENDTLDDFVL